MVADKTERGPVPIPSLPSAMPGPSPAGVPAGDDAPSAPVRGPRSVPALGSAANTGDRPDGPRSSPTLGEDGWRHRFEQVVELARDAFVEIDGEGFVTVWNRRAEEILGWGRDEVIGHRITERVLDLDYARATFGDIAAVVRDLDETARAGSDPGVTREIELVHREGHLLTASGVIFPTGGGRIGGFVHDLSAERAADEALARAYLNDPLTGLPNRALFSYRLAYAVARTRTTPGSVAVTLLDLDRFKAINDSLGHEVGDRILVAVARRLAEADAGAELIARFGGDEFLALFEAAPDDLDAMVGTFVRRVLGALALPFEVDGSEVFLTASIGVSYTTGGPNEATTLLSNAEAAMYRAKQRGGSSVETFGESMRVEVLDRMTTEHSLHRAIERSELMLYYQPVVDIVTAEPVGVEALIRWQHPEQGLVAPYRFIPVAEESGLIIPIGEWVLEEACRQLCDWQRGCGTGPRGSVDVNLSARQIDHPELVDTVERILASTGLPPENLTLEITESALMKDAASALQVLRALKGLGVVLAIDDFGTGYSSLSYLQRFPLDILKVDKSFVDELGTEHGGEEIVAAVVNLAHALGLGVVAEGVETVRQFEVLRSLGCDFAQGYLFSRPLSAADLTARFGYPIGA